MDQLRVSDGPSDLMDRVMKGRNRLNLDINWKLF